MLSKFVSPFPSMLCFMSYLNIFLCTMRIHKIFVTETLLFVASSLHAHNVIFLQNYMYNATPCKVFMFIPFKEQYISVDISILSIYHFDVLQLL